MVVGIVIIVIIIIITIMDIIIVMMVVSNTTDRESAQPYLFRETPSENLQRLTLNEKNLGHVKAV